MIGLYWWGTEPPIGTAIEKRRAWYLKHKHLGLKVFAEGTKMKRYEEEFSD